MEFLILFIMMVVGFAGLYFGYKFWGLSGLYVFALGSVVSANFYNVGDYGVSIFGLTIGIDAVIYTLFLFCVILVLFFEGYDKAREITFSAGASVAFAGIIQFLAYWLTGEIVSGLVWGLLSFIFSAIGTIIPLLLCIKLYHKWDSKLNQYILVLVLLIIASLLNSIIYFGLTALFSQSLMNGFVAVLLGSYLIKFATIIFAIFTFYFIKQYKMKK